MLSFVSCCFAVAIPIVYTYYNGDNVNTLISLSLFVPCCIMFVMLLRPCLLYIYISYIIVIIFIIIYCVYKYLYYCIIHIMYIYIYIYICYIDIFMFILTSEEKLRTPRVPRDF